MKITYQTDAIRTLKRLCELLNAAPAPVLLLEGIRKLPVTDQPALVALGRLLAQRLPRVRFRSGNAKGTDTAFAEGVVSVAPERMEYVMPNARMGRKRLAAGCDVWDLASLPPTSCDWLAEQSIKASPRNRSLVRAYCTERGNSAFGAKGAYLMRDTLKVVGHPETGLSPATAALFYVNPDDPLSGGTGHTLRVCLEQHVPSITQADWLNWLQEGG